MIGDLLLWELFCSESDATRIRQKRSKMKIPLQMHQRSVNMWLYIFVIILLFPIRVEHNWWFFSTLSLLEITLSFFFLAVIFIATLRKRLYIGELWVFVLLALPLILSLVSIVWSVDVRITFKSIVVYSSALACFIVTVSLFRNITVRQFSLLILLLPIVLIGTAVLSYLPHSILRPELVIPTKILMQNESFILSYKARFSHPFLGLSNSFATILAMLLPLVLLVRKLGLYRKWSWFVTVLTLAAILATGSRGVILAVAIPYMGAFFWRLITKLRITTSGILLVIASVLLAIIFIFTNSISAARLADRLSMVNIVERFLAFSKVFEVLNNYPQGVGSGVLLSSVSNVSISSVHNSYLQNLLWFGWLGGLLLTIAMWFLPLAVLFMQTLTTQAWIAKKALVTSLFILLLINMSQASWEGSVIRIWIYFIIAMGLVFIRQIDNKNLKITL